MMPLVWNEPTPAVVTRPTTPNRPVYQRFPSGPAVIPNRSPCGGGPAVEMLLEKLLIEPSGPSPWPRNVNRPTCEAPPITFSYSVYQMLPSGPAVIDSGAVPPVVGNWVITGTGEIGPRLADDPVAAPAVAGIRSRAAIDAAAIIAPSRERGLVM